MGLPEKQFGKYEKIPLLKSTIDKTLLQSLFLPLDFE